MLRPQQGQALTGGRGDLPFCLSLQALTYDGRAEAEVQLVQVARSGAATYIQVSCCLVIQVCCRVFHPTVCLSA